MTWVNLESDRELLFGLLSPAPGERILDVGAGKGVVAKRVLETARRVEVYAIDPDKKRVASMKLSIPRLRTDVAQAESIPFPDSFFDKVYTTMAVHHFVDLDRALGELARVLKRGGLLVILEVDPRSGRGRLFRFIENGIKRRHMRFMGKDEVVERLSASGSFKVLRVEVGNSGYFIQCVKEPGEKS